MEVTIRMNKLNFSVIEFQDDCHKFLLTLIRLDFLEKFFWGGGWGGVRVQFNVTFIFPEELI